MRIRLRLFPPLSDVARASELSLEVEEKATLGMVVEALIARFGDGMRGHLFDTEGRIIPSWAVFLKRRIIPFNHPEALKVRVEPEDEVSFILNNAGG